MLTLEGRVIDTTMSPVANAQIAVVDIATGQSRRALTNSAGEFRMLGLNSGRYSVAASAIGYRNLARTVELVVGQSSAQILLQMETAATELPTIAVVAAPLPTVEIQRTSVSTPVTEHEIRNLPLDTRNVMELGAVAPGIRSFRSVNGGELPTAGALRGERFINLYLDGVEMKSLFEGNLVGWPQFGSPLPAEALKEFRVYISPYDVEFARGAAYVISTVTQRGTNDAHASVFGFYQDGNLVSSDFLSSLSKSGTVDFRRQQLGLNLRGPIRRNRLFYAASYELSNTRDYVAVVPGKPGFDPGFWDRYAGLFPAPDRNHTGLVRFTYTPTDANTFDAIWSTRHLTNEGLFGADLSYEAARLHKEAVNTVNLRQRWLPTATFMNELSLQWVDWKHRVRPIAPGPYLDYPTLDIGRPQTRYEVDETHLRLVDRLTHAVDGVFGSHLLKAGMELARVRSAHTNAQNAMGSFVFENETDSLPSRATLSMGSIHPNSDEDAGSAFSAWTIGAYMSDEWRPSSRLTLTLGLRYDAEINTLNNGFTVPWAEDTVLNTRPELQRFLNRGNRKNDLDNIAPRLSFTWDAFNNGRTFVRGGFGIMYDRVLGFIGFDERRDATWRTYVIDRPGTMDIEVLRQRILSNPNAGRPLIRILSEDMEAPESRQWSIGIGQQLLHGLSLNLDYIHQDVSHIYAQANANAPDSATGRPALTSKYDRIILWDDFARAQYRALLTHLTYQPSTAARIALAYTLGDAKAEWDVANQNVPAASVERFYAMQRTSGDERHRLVLSGVVSLPFGLTLSTITTVASPRPYKSIVGVDVNRNGFREDDWIDDKRYREPDDKWQNWYRMVDVRLSQSIRLPGNVRMSLVAEAFNIFNTENHASYVGNSLNTNFGQPDGVFAPRMFQLGTRIQF